MVDCQPRRKGSKVSTRKSRLAAWDAEAPKGAVRIGFGGSSYEHETAVYMWRGFEIRFPFRPSAFRPNAEHRRMSMDAYAEIESGYGCFSAPDWEQIIDVVGEEASNT